MIEMLWSGPVARTLPALKRSVEQEETRLASCPPRQRGRLALQIESALAISGDQDRRIGGHSLPVSFLISTEINVKMAIIIAKRG